MVPQNRTAVSVKLPLSCRRRAPPRESNVRRGEIEPPVIRWRLLAAMLTQKQAVETRGGGTIVRSRHLVAIDCLHYIRILLV